MSGRELWAVDLGLMEYGEALALQERLVAAKASGELEADVLLLLEHPPVLTLGLRGDAGNIIATPDELAARGVAVHHVERGGDVTYHGPGQLVGYPIVSLRRLPKREDVGNFVWTIQEALIRTLAGYGITAQRIPKVIGVWVRDPSPDLSRPDWDESYRAEVESFVRFEDRKIAAIGARIKSWTSYHGFALNVHTDLRDFGLIVPCGIEDKGVTSMEAELGHRVSMDAVKRDVAMQLAAAWQHRLVWKTVESLMIEAAQVS